MGDKPPEWMTAPAVEPHCYETKQGCDACGGLTQTGLDNRTK